MEYAEIALSIFTASGITYQAFRSWREYRTPHLGQELSVGLYLRIEEQEERAQCAVLVFDYRGHLVRKFPQADCVYGKDRYRIKCTVPAGEYSFCVLLTDAPLNLSGIIRQADVERLRTTALHPLLAATTLQCTARNSAHELHIIEVLEEEEPIVNLPELSSTLPPQVVTDAMAKEIVIRLQTYSGEWSTGTIDYPAPEPDKWVSARRRGRELILQFRTNFAPEARKAFVELKTACGESFSLPICQQVMGEHPTFSVSQRTHVSSGCKNETIELTITPDNDASQWRVRKIETSDGARWWSVHPPVGTPLTGVQMLNVHLEAKPANVCSRSALLTLETGTYPFNQTTDICLTQGVCFNYYIEYPIGDACARRADVIETPLNDQTADTRKQYVVRVDSNQSWRLVKDEAIQWVHTAPIMHLPGSHDGLFTIGVDSNADNEVRGGIPAARHTVLSLINETGIVKDILIYQGGYVRIRGIAWLDRNLSGIGRLPQTAIPLGLTQEEQRRTWGSYYQFGKCSDQWCDAPISSPENWHDGTQETPVKCIDTDPSPEGWRIPSRQELSTLLNRQAYTMNDRLKGNGREYLCLLSDDGVPFFLPLCGHLSHINGSRILIPRGNRYWCGTSQSLIYGYSLCIEPSRQTSIVHDMKKYGFPVRCVLEADDRISPKQDRMV